MKFAGRPALGDVIGVVLLVLSGVGMVMAYPPFHQGWLGWVALIPCLLAGRFSPTIRARPFLSGYAVGLAYFGGVFWWIGYVTIAGTSALVAYLAIYPGLWLWLVERFRLKYGSFGTRDNLLLAAAGASAWVALEWWRGWFLTGFTWNYLGVTLHENLVFLQLASIGGVQLISWLLAFTNLTGALTLERFYREARGHQPVRAHADFAVCMVLISLAFMYGLRRVWNEPASGSHSLRYACVQANIPQDVKLARLDTDDVIARHVSLSDFALQSKPDLLLWPETATGQGIFTDENLFKAVMKLTHDNRVHFLLGAQDENPPELFNSAFVFYPGGEKYDSYHKNRRVIFGEYTPLADYLPFMRWLVPYSLDYSAGAKPSVFEMEGSGIRLAPVICFEDTQPDYLRIVNSLQPDVLINITNDGWFKSSPGAAQHLANAIFRTVEFDLPLLRCANTGITCEITPRGVVRSTLTDDKGRNVEVSGVMTGVIRIRESEVTPYERWGEWIVLLSGVAVIMFSAFPRRSIS